MPEENVEVVRKLWQALDDGDLDSWMHLCDERVEIRNPPDFPVRGPYRGHAGVRQWATEQWEVFTGLHHVVEAVLEAPDDDTVVSVQRTQGRMAHTKLKTDVEWAAVWTLKDGKVLRAQGYMSKAEALEAAGLRE